MRRWEEKAPEEASVERHKVLVDERIARREVPLQRHARQRAQRIVVVETQAVSVSREDQQEIQHELIVVQGREKAVVQETVGDEGESATANRADTIGANGWLSRAGFGASHDEHLLTGPPASLPDRYL